MKKPFVLTLTAILSVAFLCHCSHEDELFSGFQDPPADSRPFMRWWWNGNRITDREIVRQLDVLHEAGIGGVEINPIAFPEWSDTAGTKALTWLSPEWNSLLSLAATEASKREMITDLIVGSGWPFGGEFINEDQAVQRVITGTLKCRGGDIINETTASLLGKTLQAQSRQAEGEAFSNSLFFISLVPDDINNTTDITDITAFVDSQGRISYRVPDGDYDLVYGFLQKGHRHVQNGAPGAAGPVMDHYRSTITQAYLNRLKKISEDTGIPLSQLIRALFCDSIELAGANWTDGFEEIFVKTYGYELKPWFPFIFYESYRGYADEKYNEDFTDSLKRVRYDYNKLLVRVFLDNFTSTFQEFCTENGLLCRYQAYGTPFLMGMMEGNMIPDIPESNNWIYSVNMDTDDWIWNQDHGYMIWNLYAASGGHLKGRKIISCEAMTNTKGVFKASLEEIKRHDDMNFITGINHTVLHGYNYSPAESGFPGWIRFGAYFSEQNTWWPYFKHWVDYNARLSYIFQNSVPVKKIAIVGPEADIWSTKGLIRVPFHNEPWYCYRLWESLSQAGRSCDYIDEKIILDAVKKKGHLDYGPMSYEAVILCDLISVEAETALALKDFVTGGGKLVIVDGIPRRSASLKNAPENDQIVRDVFSEISERYPEMVLSVDGPANPAGLLDWTVGMLDMADIEPDVMISNPDKNVFQIRQTAGTKDIWFFVNSNRSVTATFNTQFPTGNKIPWIWDPETGERSVFPYYDHKNSLSIVLEPLQSLLLVFEPGNEGNPVVDEMNSGGDTAILQGPWSALFTHVDGSTFERSFQTLEEFGTSEDPMLSKFAGTVTYSVEFDSDGKGQWLEIKRVAKGVTEVFINGKPAGLKWYGKPVFRIAGLLREGENRLEIKYTSVLSNYVRSLKDNPTAARWTQGYEAIPMGLEGEVWITGKRDD